MNPMISPCGHSVVVVYSEFRKQQSVWQSREETSLLNVTHELFELIHVGLGYASASSDIVLALQRHVILTTNVASSQAAH